MRGAPERPDRRHFRQTAGIVLQKLEVKNKLSGELRLSVRLGKWQEMRVDRENECPQLGVLPAVLGQKWSDDLIGSVS